MRRMFLNGTAMSGQKDHAAVAGARFIGPAQTAPRYRFFAVRDEFPGLFPVDADGRSIAGELYEMTEEILFESLLPSEPAELEVGTIELDDGQIVNAMQLQPERIVDGDSVVDIAELGGWRRYQAHLAANTDVRGFLGVATPSLRRLTTGDASIGRGDRPLARRRAAPAGPSDRAGQHRPHGERRGHPPRVQRGRHRRTHARRHLDGRCGARRRGRRRGQPRRTCTVRIGTADPARQPHRHRRRRRRAGRLLRRARGDRGGRRPAPRRSRWGVGHRLRQRGGGRRRSPVHRESHRRR